MAPYYYIHIMMYPENCPQINYRQSPSLHIRTLSLCIIYETDFEIVKSYRHADTSAHKIIYLIYVTYVITTCVEMIPEHIVLVLIFGLTSIYVGRRETVGVVV